MVRFIKLTYHSVILLIVPFMFMACGLVDDDKPTHNENEFAKYDSISPTSGNYFDVKINASVWDRAEGHYVEIQDGSYVKPGAQIFRIKTTPRRDENFLEGEFEELQDVVEGSTMAQRVYISDGKCRRVEIYKDGGYYVGERNVSGAYPTDTLLIEVIYSDGRAKKEKIVLNTRTEIRAPVNKLVKEGVAVTVNTDFAKDLAFWAVKDPEMLTSLIGVASAFMCDWNLEFLVEWVLSFNKLVDRVGTLLLHIGDISPGEDTFIDIHLNNMEGLMNELNNVSDGSDGFDMRNLATIGINIDDIYSDGDVVDGPVSISFPTEAVNIPAGFVVSPIGNMIAKTILPITREPISIDLDQVLEPISDELFDIILDVLGLKLGFVHAGVEQFFDTILPINAMLYINGLSRPSENTDKLAVIYGSAFLADSTERNLSRPYQCFPDWPENVIMDASVPLDITPIKNDDIDLGIAVSEYEINSILGQLADVYEIKLPKLLIDVILTVINLPESVAPNMTGKLILNPNGMTAHFYNSDGKAKAIIIGNDISMVFCGDEGSDKKLATISMDLAFDLSIGFRWENEAWIIDVGLKPLYDMIRFHVMDDNGFGVTFLDRSNIMKPLMELIFFGEAVEGDTPEIKLAINFADILGINPLQQNDAGTRSTVSSKDGALYMNFVLDHAAPISYDKLGYWITTIFN